MPETTKDARSCDNRVQCERCPSMDTRYRPGYQLDLCDHCCTRLDLATSPSAAPAALPPVPVHSLTIRPNPPLSPEQEDAAFIARLRAQAQDQFGAGYLNYQVAARVLAWYDELTKVRALLAHGGATEGGETDPSDATCPRCDGDGCDPEDWSGGRSGMAPDPCYVCAGNGRVAVTLLDLLDVHPVTTSRALYAATHAAAEDLQRRFNKQASALADARAALDRWTEQEASVCPEDFGFVEYIGALTKQRDDARAALAAERERREFMQVHGRHLGWGFAHDDTAMRTPGVAFYEHGHATPRDPFYLFEPYGDGSKEAAEVRLIERAMAARATLSTPRASEVER